MSFIILLFHTLYIQATFLIQDVTSKCIGIADNGSEM